jgi:outer membrane protein OmpA-like peptidoglycan-associated protein
MSRQSSFGIMAAVALSALLCLPVSAQDAAPAANQPAAAAPAATTAPAATANDQNGATAQTGEVKPEPPLAAPVRQGFWGRLNPFARKKYVEGQLSPIRDRVNELNGLSADNAKSISSLDARNKAAIAAANEQVKHANDIADAAQQQVQQDSTQAGQLNDQVGQVNTKLHSIDQYQVAQNAELHFKPGPAKLNPDAEQQLSSFLQGLADQKGYVVEVTAYSTRKGRAGDTASQDLADAVVRYMVLDQNIPLYRIYTMGMGNAAPAAAQMSASGPARATAGGTVKIQVLKNSLATGSAAAPTPQS